MTDKQQEAERLLAGITPGTWAFWQCEDLFILSESPEGQVMICTLGEEIHTEDSEVEANGAFIAAAPQLVRDLLAELQRVEQERDGLDDMLQVGDNALVAICRALGVPLDWHAEPFPAHEPTLTAIATLQAQQRAAEQRAARLEAALRATGTPLPDGTHCWCPVVAEMADSHDEYCQEARALIGEVALAPAPEAQP